MSRVFVCLATYEPDLALLDRQLASLSSQTLRDWHGVVVDDASSNQDAIAERVAREPRLRLIRNSDRVGFYRNFERGLLHADAPLVALCDQDDVWRDDKLATLVRTIRGATLVHSDVRLVDRQGRVLPHVPRAYTSFRELLYNNVVTGATALFRRELLALALPFPDDAGGTYHDHWLALCAASMHGIAYVDEPLVDYVQHGGNVIGATTLADVGTLATLRLATRIATEAVSTPRALLRRLDRLAEHARSIDARLRVLAAALIERTSITPEIARALRPFVASSAQSVIDLLVPTSLDTALRREDTNLEPLKIAVGLVWGLRPKT